MQYFARSSSLIGYVALMDELGLPGYRLVRAAGFKDEHLRSPDHYVCLVQIARLLEHGALLSGRSHFGLLLGRLQGIEVVGALAAHLAAQTTLGDAAWLLERHQRFHTRGVSLHSHLEGSQLHLDLQLSFAPSGCFAQAHLLNAAIAVRAIEQLQCKTIPPLQVMFRLQRPARLRQSLVESALGCPVSWGAAQTCIVYPAALIAAPVQPAPELQRRLRSQSNRPYWPTDERDIRDTIRHAVAAMLPTGHCELATIAGLMNVHPRSLQIALAKLGSSYGALLHETRLQLACRHLALTQTDLTALALNLGFSELASFSRAFRQWTGVSPSHWRDRHAS